MGRFYSFPRNFMGGPGFLSDNDLSFPSFDIEEDIVSLEPRIFRAFGIKFVELRGIYKAGRGKKDGFSQA